MCTLDMICSRTGLHFALAILLLCTATLICGACIAQEEQKKTPRSSVDADRAFTELMSATASSDLEQMILRWEKELSDQAKVKLIRFLQIGVLRIDPEPRRLTPLEGRRLSPRQDLTLPAGRAVWAIEHLFSINLPDVQSGLSAAQLQEIDSRIAIGVKEWARERVKVRLAEMSKSERLEQARSPKPQIYPEETLLILDLLADDPEPKVRMAVLGSAWIQHPTVVRRLEEEEDPEIREMLEPLSRFAYTLPKDLPKPEGW